MSDIRLPEVSRAEVADEWRWVPWRRRAIGWCLQPPDCFANRPALICLRTRRAHRCRPTSTQRAIPRSAPATTSTVKYMTATLDIDRSTAAEINRPTAMPNSATATVTTMPGRNSGWATA